MQVAQVSLHVVTKRYDERVVLDRVSLTVRPGEKVGVIGDNGSGKSTLLQLLAGRIEPDNGEVTVAAPGGTGYLAQSIDLPPDATVQDAIDLAMRDLRELERRIRLAEAELAEASAPSGTDSTDSAAATEEYVKLIAQFEARDGYQADNRVEIALHGLGLPELDRDRRLGELSGGEQSRLALAATLASSPELLLLDEPTNDLDDRAVTWLEDYLRGHRGTVVAVTHDRVFLERITSIVLEIDEGHVHRFGDGYEGYLTAKAAARQCRIQEYEEWVAELARSKQLVANNVANLDAIPRKLPLAVFAAGPFRARGRGHGAMSRIRNAKQRVEQLTSNPVAPPADPLRFTAQIAASVDEPAADNTEETSEHSPVASLTNLRVHDRLDVPALQIGRGERILITGPNGAGKTTLLRVLAGELSPDTGTIEIDGEVGHLRQHHTPWPLELTVLEAYANGRPGHPDEHASDLLSLGLFRPAELELRIGELSYGQRRRIELARLVSDPVDLLLLDEPTNHLSPALVEELEQALESYDGALVIVTHDRRTRSKFEGTRLVIADGRVSTV